MSPQTTHKWTFRARFRKNAFGWRSQPAIKRIKEAVSEIKKVARKDPILGAEGAVTLLEKVSPALAHVDSSSGAIGTAVNNAIAALVPVIAKAPADDALRDKWLDRLWQAVESLHGRALVRLDASFCLDSHKRSCVVDAATEVGRAIDDSKAHLCWIRQTY